MYISNWDEFQNAVVSLHTASPEHVRYVHTFHRGNGELILKVTDDRVNIKYKTNQMTDLKKFVGLNSLLMLQMMNKEEADEEMTEAQVAEPIAKGAIKAKPSTPKQAAKGKKGKKRR
ncbi:signal recognition particle, SRP9/SRP14 subunit [Sporodiniella umbellata]|nr:signal recognition particle, SRP9/SRP14 subunit [Sporodiniella umbellata]